MLVEKIVHRYLCLVLLLVCTLVSLCRWHWWSCQWLLAESSTSGFYFPFPFYSGPGLRPHLHLLVADHDLELCHQWSFNSVYGSYILCVIFLSGPSYYSAEHKVLDKSFGPPQAVVNVLFWVLFTTYAYLTQSATISPLIGQLISFGTS